jgi:Protein of unknown function (DUF3224)
MRTRTLAAFTGLALGVAAPAQAQAVAVVTNSHQEHAVMTLQARGTFEVTLTPQPMHTATGGAALGRMTIDKQFHGDLEGASAGEMLSAITAVEGSAGYVAIELVKGTLNGRKGTFVLQHSGSMTHDGTRSLSVTVVPNSGTDELVGLAGQMLIIIEKGHHSYQFDYALTAAP